MDSFNPKALGKKLKKEIEQRHLNQKEIAGQAGVTPATLSLILAGKTKNPSLTTIAKIAKTIGINSIDYFLGISNDLTPQQKELIEIFNSLNDVQKRHAIVMMKCIEHIE